MNARRFLVTFKRVWQLPVCAALVVAALYILLFQHLGSQFPHLSSAEAATRVASHSLRNIASHPVNALVTIPDHLFALARPHSAAALRATSALYGLIILLLFFAIVRYWQDSFTAIIGSIMFATSSWFLHAARLATPDILLMGSLGLIACGLWLKHTSRRNLVIFVCAIAAGLAFYIPGFIWFMVAGFVWQRRIIQYELSRTKLSSKLLAVLIGLVIMAPFVIASARHSSVVTMALGLPSRWPAPLQFVRNAYHIPWQLFVHGSYNPASWLGHVPILNIFEDAMFVLGVYIFWQHRDLERSRLLLGFGILGAALIVLGGSVTLGVLLPLIYIVIAMGVSYMLEIWFSVFPRNPIARITGVIVLIALVLISCNYHLHEYFIAWPHDPATRAVFVHPANLLQ